MAHEDPTNVERQLIVELHQRVDERNRRWVEARLQHEDALRKAEELYGHSRSALEDEFAGTRAEVEREYAAAVADVETQYETEAAAARRTHDTRAGEIRRLYDATVAASQKKLDDARWMVSSVLDEDSDDSPKRRLDELTVTLQNRRQHLIDGVEHLAEDLGAAQLVLNGRRQRYDDSLPEIAPVPKTPEGAYECCEKAVTTGREQLIKLQNDTLSRLFVGVQPVIVFLLATALLFAAALFTLPPTLLGSSVESTSPSWLATIGGIAAGITIVVMVILYTVASNRCDAAYRTMLESFATAELALHNWRSWSDQELRSKQKKFQKWHDSRLEQRDRTVAQVEEQHQQTAATATQQRDADQEEIDSEFAAQMQTLDQQRAAQLERIAERRDAALETLVRREQAEPNTLQSRFDSARQTADDTLAAQQAEIQQTWQQFWDDCCRTQQDLINRAAVCSPAAEALESDTWQLPERVPEAIPLGDFQMDVETDVERLDELPPTQLTFPVLLPFANGPSLFLQATGAGRNAANDVLRATMLRILTSLPAGKVRFTIIDPVGLGEQFSSFMHLADFDELLVNSRIWTESSHIEQRLADLTEHMENVFQTYLRNEYKSIEEYNESAGEVAEPYHFLVIADFPANFTEVAARRLISIINSGARCGVNTLIGYDTSRPLPHGIQLDDFLGTATHLVWRGDHFEYAGDELTGVPLRLDAPPSAGEFTKTVRRAGDLSKNARRVEVSFDRIAPAEAELWQQDSRSGIDVPLGRAGATKLQHLRLGRGTSQHVLVAGKTGSGKSTFLHALITNTALHYGPDDVELYLVDFKKGVEFKAYANGHLPHARVIAIESDREFGVSVLQRLDGILNERGELFRSRGVQDIEMFRNSAPDERMPRIMLIVDEFQEFFTEDDKLSQTASLLLDRLVRQGRAFGVHVLLGSQTLGGAYSLARSTLGQVAVRIALQCSESDAHLILSEDNTAARLLTRPGEAIYNDANGLVQGNHPFQIAWLDDEQRAEKLRRIYNLTLRRGLQPQPPIVFEGNIPSDPENNAEINALIRAFPPANVPATGRVWLGEPVELKAASAVEFGRHAGSNMLIAGQSVDSALGILTSCLRSLGYQYPPPADNDAASAQFYVLDSLSDEHNSRDMWKQALAPTGHRIDIGGTADAARVVGALAEEIDRRTESPNESAPPIYFFAVNLAGFRDLRKDDDDFGSWGMDDDKPAAPGKQFAKILTDGPAVGVHALLWCDSFNNVTRWLGNKLLREVEIRVCFRMNANDSSQLIDTPAAGRLGPNRALLYHDSTGEIEKFRPYGVLLEPTNVAAAESGGAAPNFDNDGDDDNGGEHWDSIELFSVK